MLKQFPNLSFEQECWDQGYLALGIDEVGRGAFAGPLVMAGVVIDPGYRVQGLGDSEEEYKNYLLSLGIHDSKKLSSQKREKLAEIIPSVVFTHIISTVDVDTINSLGIGIATQICINDIVSKIKKNCPNRKLLLLMDGVPVHIQFDEILSSQKAIIHGDSISLSIAAASIIAKVYRDRLMHTASRNYPEYGFEKHVGYGTKDHRNAILKHGPCEIHRTEFIRKTMRK